MDEYSVELDGKQEQPDPKVYADILKRNLEILLEAKQLLDEDIENGSNT